MPSDYLTTPRRVEARGNLVWLSLASCCHHHFGWSSDLHPLLLEDRVGSECCTVAALISAQIMCYQVSTTKKNKNIKIDLIWLDCEDVINLLLNVSLFDSLHVKAILLLDDHAATNCIDQTSN